MMACRKGRNMQQVIIYIIKILLCWMGENRNTSRMSNTPQTLRIISHTKLLAQCTVFRLPDTRTGCPSGYMQRRLCFIFDMTKYSTQQRKARGTAIYFYTKFHNVSPTYKSKLSISKHLSHLFRYVQSSFSHNNQVTLSPHITVRCIHI